jgi:predicted MFS family arabinose efflux permease
LSAAAVPPLGRLLPGAIAALIAVYFFSQFLRNSAGVLAPDLARELALDPLALGVLSSAFFITFAAAQVPVGMAIDRFGAKRVLLASSAAAVAGCVLFALARDLSSLVTARALMGLGCSTFYVTALSIYARQLPATRFARIVGLQLGIGSFGALAATAPLAQLAQQFGWRAAFMGVAVALVLALLVATLSVPPTPPTERGGRESAADSLAGVRAVLRTPGFAPLFAVHLTSYSSFAAILALWGAPFLDDVHGLDGTQRGNVLLVMALCQIGGVLAWSRLAERLNTRKVPVFTGSVLAAGSTVLLALLPAASPRQRWPRRAGCSAPSAPSA